MKNISIAISRKVSQRAFLRRFPTKGSKSWPIDLGIQKDALFQTVVWFQKDLLLSCVRYTFFIKHNWHIRLFV